MAEASAEAVLRRGLQSLSLPLQAEQQQQLLQFIALVAKWNRKYNLTAISDPVEMVIKHLLDSLVISPYLHGETLLDVGCGAGLPSLPLALTQPQRSFTLVDSNHKKIAFVNEVKRKLALTNVTAIHARVEDLGRAEHHSIICRAFTALPRFLDLTAPLLAVDGRWLAMKGANPQRELSEVSDRYLVDEVVPLTVPELSAERHLVVVRHRA